MTVLRLLRLRSPADFADWYRLGAEYVDHVAAGMGFDRGAFPEEYPEAVSAMRANRTDIAPSLARSVAADLLADAAFTAPFLEWTPWWYELGIAGFGQLADRRLRRVAGQYASSVGTDPVIAPRFSRPQDVLIAGQQAIAGLSGFRDRFLLADAVLHIEWFGYVARESGIAVPQQLLNQTRRESVAYYTGHRESLSAPVRRFQRLLFADDAWVRGVDTAYGLDSALFGIWETILSAERRRLRARSSDGGDSPD